MARYEDMLKQQRRTEYTPGTILIPAGPRLGDEIINAKGLSKKIVDGSGRHRQLFKDVTFKVDAGAIIGIVGPNGVGMLFMVPLVLPCNRHHRFHCDCMRWYVGGGADVA